ncbi:hypothetical protein [Nonomuraea sp. NPDC049480]|uniref:hypothetical protein n=1 Tax=Nonomuraea sp. NPDC049480 TaxID=3364353 RepID=UPI0037B1C49A
MIRVDVPASVRVAAMLAVAYLLAALTMLGHLVVLVAGAIDALVTAYVGLPRLAYAVRRIVEVVRETAREEGL